MSDIWHDPLFLAALKKGGAGGSVSGDIVTFNAPKASPLKALTLSIDPVQAGTGDPSPDNVRPISGWSAANLWRTGRNLLNDSNFTTFNTSFTGWAINDTSAVSAFNTLKAGTYTMSLKSRIDSVNSSDTSGTYGIVIKSVSSDGEQLFINCRTSINTAPTVGQIITSTISFRLTDKYVGKFTNAWSYSGRARANNPDTITIYDFQIELSSTATPYTPYQGTTIPITFTEAGTVYGGVWDVIGGVLRVDRAMVDLGSLTWKKQTSYTGKTAFQTINEIADMKPSTGNAIVQPIQCSQYKSDRWDYALDVLAYDCRICEGWAGHAYIGICDSSCNELDGTEFKTAMSGVQLVYPLATPLTYTLTPQQLDTLAGQNVVWGDCGAVSLEYAGGGVSKDMMLAAILHEARQ